jgi:hypothetical protein
MALILELPDNLTEQERRLDEAADLMIGEGREPLCFCILCAPLSIAILRRVNEKEQDGHGNQGIQAGRQL